MRVTMYHQHVFLPNADPDGSPTVYIFGRNPGTAVVRSTVFLDVCTQWQSMKAVLPALRGVDLREGVVRTLNPSMLIFDVDAHKN